MLSSRGNDVLDERSTAVETRVLELVVETCGLLRGELSLTTPLFEALDSLTFVAVVARIEAAFDLVLEGGETTALLAARDVGELARLIAGKVERSRANLAKST